MAENIIIETQYDKEFAYDCLMFNIISMGREIEFFNKDFIISKDDCMSNISGLVKTNNPYFLSVNSNFIKMYFDLIEHGTYLPFIYDDNYILTGHHRQKAIRYGESIYPNNNYNRMFPFIDYSKCRKKSFEKNERYIIIPTFVNNELCGREIVDRFKNAFYDNNGVVLDNIIHHEFINNRTIIDLRRVPNYGNAELHSVMIYILEEMSPLLWKYDFNNDAILNGKYPMFQCKSYYMKHKKNFLENFCKKYEINLTY